ncbi:hypothetical protein BGW80DRAFT_1461529 [Lactifluus volemus]|nr:hypothetical protein BGW80DRAFT_1461529 [Lactifluus volemus]
MSAIAGPADTANAAADANGKVSDAADAAAYVHVNGKFMLSTLAYANAIAGPTDTADATADADGKVSDAADATAYVHANGKSMLSTLLLYLPFTSQNASAYANAIAGSTNTADADADADGKVSDAADASAYVHASGKSTPSILSLYLPFTSQNTSAYANVIAGPTDTANATANADGKVSDGADATAYVHANGKSMLSTLSLYLPFTSQNASAYANAIAGSTNTADAVADADGKVSDAADASAYVHASGKSTPSILSLYLPFTSQNTSAYANVIASPTDTANATADADGKVSDGADATAYVHANGKSMLSTLSLYLPFTSQNTSIYVDAIVSPTDTANAASDANGKVLDVANASANGVTVMRAARPIPYCFPSDFRLVL